MATTLDFPKAAVVDRIIPKTKFYERLQIAAAVRDEFTGIVGRIIWKYKLAESTINISPSTSIDEIQLFEIELKQKQVPGKALAVIDKAIPYPILYVLNYRDDTCYVMQHKLDAARRYYKTDWNNLPELPMSGSDLGTIYQRLLASFILDATTSEVDSVHADNFDELVAADTERTSLEKQIQTLGSKIRSEQQFNQKVQLNLRLQELRKRLEG